MFWMPFFAFVFTPSPLKLITCNKQWLNSVLLLALLKWLVLVLNYKCPNRYVFCFFMALLAIFLNFLRWNLPTFSQHIASFGIRILKAKNVGFVNAGFSIFANLRLLSLRENWSYRFPWKTSSGKSKTFTTNLASFTEFHRRKRKKIHCQFCLLCSCWRNKNRKTVKFSFERAQITWVFVLGARAIVKL